MVRGWRAGCLRWFGVFFSWDGSWGQALILYIRLSAHSVCIAIHRKPQTRRID
nr:MAG TPA: hypothetical protein [Caudoviricetes sp.]